VCAKLFSCVRLLQASTKILLDDLAGVQRENLDDLLVFDHDYGLIASFVHLCSANFFASAIKKQERRRTERKGGEEGGLENRNRRAQGVDTWHCPMRRWPETLCSCEMLSVRSALCLRL